MESSQRPSCVMGVLPHLQDMRTSACAPALQAQHWTDILMNFDGKWMRIGDHGTEPEEDVD